MADGYRRVEETPAIPGLPNHLVVAHVVGSDKLNDPTDLARLTAVSRGMRAAVAATKRTIKEPDILVADDDDVSRLRPGTVLEVNIDKRGGKKRAPASLPPPP